MERGASELDYTPGRSSDVARGWNALWHPAGGYWVFCGDPTGITSNPVFSLHSQL